MTRYTTLLIVLSLPSLVHADEGLPHTELSFDVSPLVLNVEARRDPQQTRDNIGLGFGLSAAYFGTHGHGVVGGVQARMVQELCIVFCDDPERFVAPSLHVGWAYRAAFGVRPHRRVWYDVRPQFSARVLRIGGSIDTWAVGGEAGLGFNIHFRRGLVLGVGGTYEALVTGAEPLHGGTVFLRFGIDLGGPAK